MKFRIIRIVCACLLTATVAGPGLAQDAAMPQIRKTDGRYQFYVDGKPFMMLGGQVGNGTHLAGQLTATWPIYKNYGANTMEFPVYWRDVEPVEGQFDFTNVQAIVRQAQASGLHLIPVWFATWKGGTFDRYIPQWVLDNKTRFPRATFADGKEAQVLSPWGEATLAADRLAFAGLLKAIKDVDATQHAVIIVQVENEPGVLGPVRDHSAAANKLFAGRIPASLVKALHKQSGTWTQVFGSRFAEEAFTTYYMARYIDAVAAGGKAAYPLPMYVNVWMGGDGTNDRFNDFDYPGESYPSGGAQSHTLDLWRAAAPHIDLIAPDIYQHSAEIYRTILSRYARPDNPLLIVETGRGLDFARYCFMAIGQFGSLGFSQFGIESATGGRRGEAPAAGAATNAPGAVPAEFGDVAANFMLLRAATPALLEVRGTPRLQSAIEEEYIPARMLMLDGYDAHVMFPPALQARVGAAYQPQADARPLSGRVLIGQTGSDEFVVLGFDAAVDFRPSFGSVQTSAKIAQAEEGSYEGQTWKATRTLEPDAQHPNRVMLPAQGALLRVRLARQ